MKKIALALILMVTISFAADAYLFGKGWSADSQFQKNDKICPSVIYIDTLTFHAKNGDSTLTLGGKYVNFRFRSLNGAGDYGSVKVAFDTYQGRWHADSVARNILYAAVGLNTADDYFYAPIAASKIYVRPVVGGTADSACILEVMFMR